ncbi:phage major capsid protein [Sphingobium sp. WTD-1]|uniref:phage major capsid protein n=1 Tax=Sphingobium sp. WTD-1 TaxID=2979467 RepID=UPI0024DE8CA6|nr:phage major capsid protein [Sphingobium sp. WTD-1]WIA55191.1 phage major capsid protein [Sphingobium sp. WTD-1]
MSDLTPEQIKALTDSVEALRTETESNIKSSDAVTQEKISKIEASVSDLLAAKNAPNVDSIEESADLVKEAIGMWFKHGDEVLQRGEGRDMLIKAVGDQVSLTVATEGGNVLPKIFGGLIDTLLRQSSPLRGVSRVIQSGMNYVQPIKFNGGTAATRAEFGAIHQTVAPQFDTITFTNFEVNAEEKATHWAHEGDAIINLVDVITSDVVSAIAEKESELFLVGMTQNPLATGGTIRNGLLSQTKLVTGVNERTSVLGSLAGVETASATEIDFTDFATARSTLANRYNGTWMFGKQTELALMTLKDLDGRYIWSMGDVKSGTTGAIFGDSYVISDFIPTFADGEDVPFAVYGDFSRGYVIADASPLRWTVDNLTDKVFVKYLARRRTSSSVVDFGALRGLYKKAA